MASDRQTSQESAQLLRRAVAITTIPSVTVRTIEHIRRALYPDVTVGVYAEMMATVCNRHKHIDSICQILADTDPADSSDLPKSIARHERFASTIVKSSDL